MIIRDSKTSDKENWNKFVNSHPQASPYHLYGWNQAVTNAYGFKSISLIAEKDNVICGILPMVFVKKPIKSGEMVSLPYCDVGTILSTNFEAKKQLLKKAINVAKELNAKVIDLRGDIENSIIIELGLSFQENINKVRLVLQLPDSSERLWLSFKSKLRSQIKKAEKNNLCFTWGNNLINDFYSVFSVNMRDLGSPVHSKKWFREVFKQYGQSARLGLVFQNKFPIGAGIILRSEKAIAIPWASTLRKYNRLNPNMLLYWNFLKYASDNGCRLFDFGRSTPGEGTYRFKTQWGAEPVPLYWYNIYLNENLEPKPHKTLPDNRDVLAQMWSRLPVSVANIIGPVIRKYISL